MGKRRRVRAEGVPILVVSIWKFVERVRSVEGILRDTARTFWELGVVAAMQYPVARLTLPIDITAVRFCPSGFGETGRNRCATSASFHVVTC